MRWNHQGPSVSDIIKHKTNTAHTRQFLSDRLKRGQKHGSLTYEEHFSMLTRK